MREMRKFMGIFFTSLFLVVLTVGNVMAAEEKVGGVDPQSLVFQHPQYEQVMKQLKDIAEAKDQEARAAIAKESDNNKKAEIFQKMRMEVAEEERKLMQPIFKDIELAIRTVAAAKNVTVVVDKAALLFGGIDITEDVVQEIKRRSASGG
ncbi:MAG: OmpH family outer membrane protein [Synergistaceae bacterium]|jgi:outer membrane protein|nr:OmpH family outer membrane protein [Synergistaceae bacterium]